MAQKDKNILCDSGPDPVLNRNNKPDPEFFSDLENFSIHHDNKRNSVNAVKLY